MLRLVLAAAASAMAAAAGPAPPPAPAAQVAADLGERLILRDERADQARGVAQARKAYADPKRRRRAAVVLGQAYVLGRGAPADRRRGLELLEEAGEAADGDALASYLLGRAAQEGWAGRPRDPARALRRFRRCAELGNAHCNWDVGMAYLAGEGVAKDETEALGWVRKAAEAGDVRGELSLGVMLALGQGTAVDYAQSRAWYQRAAERGSTHALRELGGMSLRGEGGPADEETAWLYLELAADAGDRTAAAIVRDYEPPVGPAGHARLDARKAEWIAAHGRPSPDD